LGGLASGNALIYLSGMALLVACADIAKRLKWPTKMAGSNAYPQDLAVNEARSGTM